MSALGMCEVGGWGPPICPRRPKPEGIWNRQLLPSSYHKRPLLKPQPDRDFVVRGSVVDTAVGLVFGLAFSQLLNAFVSDAVTPWIGVFIGEDVFTSLYFTIRGSKFDMG